MKNWVDRYVYEVGEKLSKKQREDIKEELRSSILDAIDERVEEKRVQIGPDYEATEEDVFTVLDIFGAPAEVAKKYLPNHRYLIGPELFELYRLVMTITLIAVAIGLGVSTVVSAFEINGDIYKYFYKLPGDIISGLINAVGSVTIVFAMIQYFTPDHQLDGINLNKSWRAKELAPIPFPYNRIKRSESIVAICFTILAMMVFNLFPDMIALYQFSDGALVKASLFNVETLRPYMLVFNGIWIIQILHHIYNLKSGHWTIPSRFIAIFISLATLAAILYTANNPEIINSQINSFPFPKDIKSITSMMDLIGKIFKGVLVLIIIGTVWDCIKNVYYMFKK